MIGKKAPEFCLKDSQEKEICLKDFKGKWVVVYFYPKDNTPGCTMEAQGFSMAQEEFEKENTVVFGISPDSCESHSKFIFKKDLTVTLLSDPEKKVIESYGALGKKKMFGREFTGVIRSTFLVAPDGKIVHKWPKVRVKGHVNEVLETLKSFK